MKKGTVIFLNGVTSSGKTSISKQIQNLADINFYHLSNDMFHNAVSEKFWRGNSIKYISESIVAMYHAAKGIAVHGINIIIDGMLCEFDYFMDEYGMSHYDIMEEALSDLDILMVKVFCPLEECKKRNIARGDRGESQSDWQNGYMNKSVKYDLSVDTSVYSAEDCAKQILDVILKLHLQ